MIRPTLLLGVLAVFGSSAMTAQSDEGMWLLTDPPRERLKSSYGFDLTDAWLRKVMLASVRLNNGGSGGFVSPRGLVVTNHHVAADSIQKLSSKEKNYYRDGFQAKSEAAELKCPDLELNVLQSIEDVTAPVNAAVKAGMSAAEAVAARRAVMSEIEKESLAKTGLRSDVVTLYQGGVYHLYRYKKYTDVRLVFCPEAAAGGFGGDVDNFEFPRFGFDVSFFRVYENGQPLKCDHYFRWSTTGPAENDLAFVTGHPGTTNRLETVAKLTHRRDHFHPYTLARLRTMEAAILQYAERGPEERRQAASDLHRVANARKAFSGQYQGLLDPKILAEKQRQEDDLKAKAAAQSPEAAASFQSAIDRIASANSHLNSMEKSYLLIETGQAFPSELFPIARHLVRLSEELPKPSNQRLREYRDSNLDSLKLQLFSPAPLAPALERVKLATGLTFLAENLGGGHSTVATVLNGRNPAARAEELIAGCTLFDPAERRKLFDGGAAAIQASKDPMILLARSVDGLARTLRKEFEENVEEPERQGFADLAKLRFAAYGKNIAPDATFTLRLAYGQVKGYSVDGANLPFHTTVRGAFERSESMQNREPFDLPASWLNAKSRLDPATPFNFVSTADTIGGNSGSPVLNRAGELIGVNFDRNRHGLVRNFVYTDVQARHVAVHSRIVLAALEHVYDAKELLGELTGR